jgi:hypothetical protein
VASDDYAPDTSNIDDDVFVIPLLALFLAGVSLLAIILWFLTQSFLPEIFDKVFLLVIIVSGSLANVFSYASIITYYKDAEALEAIQANWVPIWWIYAIATIFLGIIILPIYSIQRIRHTSVDWAQIRLSITNRE